jgi:ATP-dependent Clp protease adaptor protein ClpS
MDSIAPIPSVPPVSSDFGGFPSAPLRRANAPEPATPEVEPASPGVEVLEKEDDGTGTDHPWRVILFNDEVHTFDEVIRQLVKATGCSESQAETLAWKVHSEGKANVYEGTFEECFEVQAVLKEIQLVTEIRG